jgi:hypothetical protein
MIALFDMPLKVEYFFGEREGGEGSEASGEPSLIVTPLL